MSEQASSEFGCMFVRFNAAELAHIDACARRLNNAPREVALRTIICAFGKKWDIDIPFNIPSECPAFIPNAATSHT